MDATTGGEARLRLLGPVVAVHADEPATSPSAMVRTLLALLALDAGRPDGTSVVVEELWGDALPKDPKNALQVLVARLRKWLPSAGLDVGALRFGQDTYVLDIEPADVDLARFTRDAQRAHDESAPVEERLAAADRALGYWTGEPFTGCVRGPLLDAEARRLDELRLTTLELRHELALQLGRHDEVAADLGALALQYPERERLARSAMLALYRAGRQHDALAVYQSVRNHLVEEYGLDVSAELSELEARILARDVSLHAPSAPPAVDAPNDDELVGRAADLAQLRDAIGSDDVRLLLVTGEAGIGKSTLIRRALGESRESGAAATIGSWDGDPSPLSVWTGTLGALGVGLADMRANLRGEALAPVLTRQLGELARQRPLVLALDDVHLADSASLVLLVAVAKLGIPHGVTIIASAREPDVEAHPHWLAARAELARAAGFARVALAPLSEAAVTDLVRARLADADTDPDGEIAAVVWKLTAGHPLHAAALLDVMRAEPDVASRRAAARRVPDALRPLVQFQVASFDRACRDAVELLAIRGRTSPATLARLRGTTIAETVRDLRPALDAGLVDERNGRLGVRHALARAAVVAEIPSTVRRSLHQVCFEDARARHADPFRVLRHADGAGGLIPAADLGAARLAAGKVAYDRGAFAEAQELLTAARPLLSDSAEIEALLFLGLVNAAVGAGDAAEELLDEVVRGTDADTAPEILIAAALGHDPLAVTVRGNPRRLARLRIVAERTASLETQSRFDLVLALLIEERIAQEVRVATNALGEMERLAALLDSKVDQARVADMRTREWFDNSTVDVATRLSAARGAYELARSVEDPHVLIGTIESYLAASLAVGDVERAQDLRWELQRVGERSHRAHAMWAAAVIESALMLAAGDAGADDAAAAARELGERLGLPDVLGSFGVHTFVALFLQGKVSDAAPIAELATAMYPNVPAWLAATTLAYAHAGRSAEARTHLDRYLAARAASTTHLFDRPGLCLAAAAAYALEEPVAAKAVLHALRPDPAEIVVIGLGVAVLGPVDFYVGLAEQAVGDRGAAARLDAAAKRTEELEWVPWTAAIRDPARVLGLRQPR